ncbi:MAG: hypothetical protein MJ182_02695 [Treponema sp.]|nr:hypothetical protein [Treponema sp.]
MFARTIKKAFLFFVVDIFIIIGIFVLQFSNDSIITEKNGNLQITLSETKDNNNNTILRNKLTLVFNGVTVSCDDNKPAQIVRSGADAEKEPVSLVAWKKSGDLSYEFDFTEDVKLKVALSDLTEKGALSFTTEVPAGISAFYIPYNLATNTEISDRSSTRILMGSKKALWEFNASSLDENLVGFIGTKTSASFSFFEQTVEFKFASLSGASIVGNYDAVVRDFRNSIISSYKSSSAEVQTNETSVVAYVSEQASRGNYSSALEEVPQSFKRSENRTYLSSTFFNNLTEMNKTLDADIKEKDAIIRKAVNNYSLSLYTIRNIANYMYLYSNSGTIKRITENAGNAVIENCSLAEAAGILRTYVEMMPLSKAYASHMEDSLNDCVEKIEKSCKMEGNTLTIAENGTFLSVVQAVEVGDALLRYGQFIGDQSLIAGGKAIIASYIAETSSFDMRTLGDLYPVIVHNNTYYPHFVKIYTSGDHVVWAWTSAEGIGYERGEDRSVTFNIDFPSGYTHYMIIRGISPFRNIYIYDMAFRTDPRFESYNSSGYVYDADSSALLLKSRHKAEKEVVRLTYAAPVVAQPESSGEVKTEPAVESKAVEASGTETEKSVSEESNVTNQKQQAAALSDEEIKRRQAEAAAKAAAQAAAQASYQAAQAAQAQQQ